MACLAARLSRRRESGTSAARSVDRVGCTRQAKATDSLDVRLGPSAFGSKPDWDARTAGSCGCSAGSDGTSHLTVLS